MKKKFFAFTLIELLVVISIIMIISSSWVMYFFDFINKQKNTQELEIIKNDFENYDREVKNFRYFDYSIFLNTKTWSLAYIYYINMHSIDKYQTIDFDSNTWTWVIIINWLTTDKWWSYIYIDNKHKNEYNISWWQSYTWSYLEADNYIITWTLSWSVLNEIWIKYFSNSNIDKEKWVFLELTEINTSLDKTWTSYDSLKISRLLSKKEIIWNWVDSLDKVYLFFESDGMEDNILIKK